MIKLKQRENKEWNYNEDSLENFIKFTLSLRGESHIWILCCQRPDETAK